jgi:hypothetical protein
MANRDENLFFSKNTRGGDSKQQAWARPDAKRDEGAAPQVGGDLATLLRNLGGAQANDAGWPLFNRKYMNYPRFRKEWWPTREPTMPM